jgi:hypothetical protein
LHCFLCWAPGPAQVIDADVTARRAETNKRAAALKTDALSRASQPEKKIEAANMTSVATD